MAHAQRWVFVALLCALWRKQACAQSIGDSTLADYVENGTLWRSRGSWYNIEAWAARTSNCVGNATSVACMACSMERPGYAVDRGVAPIAVANKLWFAPERGAVCGMCLKVFMPNGTTTSQGCPDPHAQDPAPGCPGTGSQPYLTGVGDPLNYGATVTFDADRQLYYFLAVVVEWFDRNQTDEYALSYPTQKRANVDQFGTWPIIYEGVPCPVGGSKLLYNFIDAATPVPVAASTNDSGSAWQLSGSSPGLPAGVSGNLCNNLADRPCGQTSQVSKNPLGFVKMQITGQRIPIAAVELRFSDGAWRAMKRSGDNYWEPAADLDFTPDASAPVDVRVTCAVGGPPLVEPKLVPAAMLCAYQDPACRPFEGTVQC